MSFGQQFLPPVAAPAPVAPPFYQTTMPAPFYPTAPAPPPFVQTQAPQPVQFRPQPWSPPIPPAPVVRVPVMPAPVPAQAPQQMQQAPAFQPQAFAPGLPIHFQVPQGLNFSALGYYGYAPDNMWGAMASVPPMWRPQQPGESFARRWAVNVGLNATETILQQLLLGVRQMFMPPMPTKEGPVIEVK